VPRRHELGGSPQHGREDDPDVVQDGRERQDLEVRDGDQPALVGDDDRVALVRVQLDREDPVRVGQRVAGRALELRQVPVRERVLEVPRRAGVEDRGALEEPPDPTSGSAPPP
jgi:hypothetical protein